MTTTETMEQMFRRIVREEVAAALGAVQPLIPTDEAARMLKCTERTVRKELLSKGIRVEKVGRKWFVKREHLSMIAASV